MDFGLGGLGHDGGIGDHGLEHCWHSPILRLSMPNFYHSHHFYFDQSGIFLRDEVNLRTILEVHFEVQIYSKNWTVWNSICHLILMKNPGKKNKKICLRIWATDHFIVSLTKSKFWFWLINQLLSKVKMSSMNQVFFIRFLVQVSNFNIWMGFGVL